MAPFWKGEGAVYLAVNRNKKSVAVDLKSDVGRDIVLRLPHFVVAPEIVQNTDLAVIFPKSIAQRFNRNKAFRILPLPFSLPPIEIQVHTHMQFSADPGIAWLRDAICSMFSTQGSR